MHQAVYSRQPWEEAHHYGMGYEVPIKRSAFVARPPRDTGSPPHQYMDHQYQHNALGHDHRLHYHTSHQVVTPHRVSRLVHPHHQQGYHDLHHEAYYENEYAPPMVSPPMKIRYIRHPNCSPEGSQVYGQHDFGHKSHGPVYPVKRQSEDSSLPSPSFQQNTKMARWQTRKVSFGGDSSASATEEEAKLLLDATAAFHREVPSDVTESHCPFTDKIEGCEFVSLDLYGSVPDSLFLAMAQMKVCRLNDEDRFGNYKHRKLGMVGMACKHCGGLSGFGRHFPSSFQSLLSGSHCLRIVRHMRSECRACPPEIRHLIVQIDQQNDQVSFDHGSRKRFVAHVWSRLQTANGVQLYSDETPALSDRCDELDDSERSAKAQLMDNDDIPWESILSYSELVEAKDRHLVPDSTFFAISQMKSYALREEDRIGRHKDQPLGFIGEITNRFRLSLSLTCFQECAVFTAVARQANLDMVDSFHHP